MKTWIRAYVEHVRRKLKFVQERPSHSAVVKTSEGRRYHTDLAPGDVALFMAADQVRLPFHLGLTASTSGFFGAQGREVGGLKPRDPGITERLTSWNVLNMEMESSTLFTLGSLAAIRTGMVCAVYSNRVRGECISDAQRSAADEKTEFVALETVRVLAAMDAWKAEHQKQNFIPQIAS